MNVSMCCIINLLFFQTEGKQAYESAMLRIFLLFQFLDLLTSSHETLYEPNPHTF